MPGTASSGGRNAKDPAHHRAAGTFRGDRHEGFEAPEPPLGRPVAPKSLKDPVARAEWERMVDRMEQSKTLALVDDAALYQYVQLHAETERIVTDNAEIRKLSSGLKRATRKLDGQALVDAIGKIVDLQGVLARHTQQLRQGHMAIRQYLVEFGMTPAARPRVKITATKKPASKLVAFMGGKQAAGA